MKNQNNQAFKSQNQRTEVTSSLKMAEKLFLNSRRTIYQN